jgi:LacI family transcriptional regulator
MADEVGLRSRSTLRDVAVAAEVSLRTASRVLNDDPLVATSTRARVQEAMAALDYRPDAMARSLRAGTDATVGLVVESIGDPFFAALAEAVEHAATAQDRSVLVASTHRDAAREREVVERMLARRVAGLLLVPASGDHAWLAGCPVPCVLVDRPAPGITADVVRIDDHRAAFDAVGHLVAHGHREIGYVGDLPTVATSADRLAGYRAAMERHSLPVRDGHVRADAPTAQAAAIATRSLLTAATPPTALLSAATRCSLGVVPTLHALGRTGVALVGLGDFAMADTLAPAGTVVDHPPACVGAAAAARLARRLADPAAPVETVHVPVRLVERGSGEQRP